ncbi:MAG: DUF2442 domain-containing protein [Cyanobacteria bacterium J06627_28]
MAEPEDTRKAISARYLLENRELEISLEDGSRYLVPVDRLEMVRCDADGFIPIEQPTDEQLLDVKVWGGGASIQWELLEQTFLVEELLEGIYGREAWMRSLLTIAE